MKISVLGCGRWGSFISWYLVNHDNQVIEWGRCGGQTFENLKKLGKNEYVSLDKRIDLTSDLVYTVKNAEIIIVSISAQSFRELAQQIVKIGLEDKKIVLCMKGLEEDTGKRLTEVAIESGIRKENIAVWVGPGHIQAFTKGSPNCMVIDGYNDELVKYLCDNFKSNLIRFYYGGDIIGTEIGSASKNVMGIVAGMLDGLNLATLKGALMSRGAREVARLIKAMGGNELSAYGLSHLGDYETTLFSEYSNNRKFGEMFIKGEPFTKLAEGVKTAFAMQKLGIKYQVDLPITNALIEIIDGKTEPLKVLNSLFSRTTKYEF